MVLFISKHLLKETLLTLQIGIMCNKLKYLTPSYHYDNDLKLSRSSSIMEENFKIMNIQQYLNDKFQNTIDI